jgi:hypothetical protein
MEGMGNLAQTIPIIEESFSYGKYTLLSFPAKCVRSPAITMLRLEFSQRLHAQYWLCPHYSEKIQNLLTAYEKLRDTRAKILDANDEFIREYASAARSLGSPFEALAAESIVEDTFIPAITLYEEINERVATALRGLVQRNFEDATLVYAT